MSRLPRAAEHPANRVWTRVRYDPRNPQARRPALARAKNTSRADARRRTRETQRAELAAEAPDDIESTPDEQSAPQQRPPLFKMPNIREDARALPEMFRTKRLMWVPLLLFAAGFLLVLVYPGLPSPLGDGAVLYLQFFFVPPALFTFFIAGFVAPRASYLVGLVYGLLAGVVWSVGYLVTGALASGSTTTPPPDNPVLVSANLFLFGLVYGTLGAAFAGWYRDFLRRMQENSRQKRVEQEAKDRARRREERQEARRVAKRPTS